MKRIQYLFLTVVLIFTACNKYELLHIDGYVYDFQDHLPVEDATVVIVTPNYDFLYSYDGKISCHTDSEGYFYLQYYRIDLRANEYWLKAFHDHIESSCVGWDCNSIDIDPDISQTVDLYLKMEDSYYLKK